jgi:hypothetical protein
MRQLPILPTVGTYINGLVEGIPAQWHVGARARLAKLGIVAGSSFSRGELISGR